jgi:hypothetical protein
MISRIFAVDHNDGTPMERYKGFNKNFAGEVQYIALVKDEGSIEVWALDDSPHARSELIRYYKDTNTGDNWSLLGVFLNTNSLR